MTEIIDLIARSINIRDYKGRARIEKYFLVSQSLDREKQISYIYKMLGFNTMWVSVPNEKIAELPIPALFINTSNSSKLNLLFKDKSGRIRILDRHINNQNGDITLDYFNLNNCVFFIFEKNKYSTIGIENYNSGISNYLAFIVGLVILILLTLCNWILNDLKITCIWVLSIIGVSLFYNILNYTVTKNNNIIAKICTIENNTSCSNTFNFKVFNNNVFDFKRLGLIYFLSMLITLFYVTLYPTVYLLNLFIPLGFSGLIGLIFSIYIQGFILKKICKVCLFSFLIIMTIEIFIISGFNYSTLQISELFLGLYFICISAIVVHLYSNNLEIKAYTDSIEATLVSFKTNKSVFRGILGKGEMKGEHHEFGVPHFYFENISAKESIGLVISLKCKYCFKAICQAMNILDINPKYNFKIWFATNNIPSKLETEFLNTLMEDKENLDLKILFIKLEQWYRQKRDEVPFSTVPQNNIFIKGIGITPLVLINDSIIPSLYDLDDIGYILST